MQFIIISGLSGAGKSKAGEFLEDAGFYTVDNMPAVLMPRFAELCQGGANSRYDRVALVSDVRGGVDFTDLFAALDEMKAQGCDCKLLFLEASTEAVIQRYKETRRIHPLCAKEGGTLESAVQEERKLLEPVRARADYIVDSTTFVTTAKLRSALMDLFCKDQKNGSGMEIHLVSFGYKYGLPLEADLALDVRFLPNPFYVPELRKQTGLDAPVQEYLYQYPQTRQFLDMELELLKFLLPQYAEEGKTSLTIAIGCTGGQHRSVAMCHALAEELNQLEYPLSEHHRDMMRDRK